MVGKLLCKGIEVSPYCNIKFLKSLLPLNNIPCNSDISRSNQLADGNKSVMESMEPFKFNILDLLNFKKFLVNIKCLS